MLPNSRSISSSVVSLALFRAQRWTWLKSRLCVFEGMCCSFSPAAYEYVWARIDVPTLPWQAEGSRHALDNA